MDAVTNRVRFIGWHADDTYKHMKSGEFYLAIIISRLFRNGNLVSLAADWESGFGLELYCGKVAF